MSILEKYFRYSYYLTLNYMKHIFCVYINEAQDDVHIYTRIENVFGHYVEDFQQYVASFKPLKVFIGKSTIIPRTIVSGSHGSTYDGNSILLKMDTNKYIFIGSEIYSFTTEYEIVSFFSHLGDLNRSYPHAIDSEGNFYFLARDYAVLKIDDETNRIDPYEYLHNVIKNIGDTENIKCLHIGDEKYYIHTSANPKEEYEKLVNKLEPDVNTLKTCFGNNLAHIMKIEYKDDTIKPIYENEFIELLTNYNKKVGLRHISDITMNLKSFNGDFNDEFPSWEKEYKNQKDKIKEQQENDMFNSCPLHDLDPRSSLKKQTDKISTNDGCIHYKHIITGYIYSWNFIKNEWKPPYEDEKNKLACLFED